jgi:hypothetical protein
VRDKFSELPGPVQVIVVALTIAVLAVWAGAFVYSYNALYAVGAKIPNTSRVVWMWPFLLDGQIVAANFGLALATAFDRNKGLMKFWVAVSLAASVGFNVWHVIDNRVLWLVAAVAPISIEGVCFVGVKVLDMVLTALGRPTTWKLPDKQVGTLKSLPQTTVVQLPDGSWGVPTALPHQGPPEVETSSGPRSSAQLPHRPARVQALAKSGYGAKRMLVTQYLDEHPSPPSPDKIAQELGVSERYVKQLMHERRQR